MKDVFAVAMEMLVKKEQNVWKVENCKLLTARDWTVCFHSLCLREESISTVLQAHWSVCGAAVSGPVLCGLRLVGEILVMGAVLPCS